MPSVSARLGDLDRERRTALRRACDDRVRTRGQVVQRPRTGAARKCSLRAVAIDDSWQARRVDEKKTRARGPGLRNHARRDRLVTAAAATAAASTATTAAAAAATVAATAATAAAAAAVTTAAAAAAARALRLVLGSVDADGAAVERRAVHRLLGGGTIGRILITDEAEAARATGLTVGHDLRLDDGAEATKRLAQAIIRCVPAQTTNKKLL